MTMIAAATKHWLAWHVIASSKLSMIDIGPLVESKSMRSGGETRRSLPEAA
jgi:hypothetical protein